MPVDIGVIGCGYWGPNLVRTFVEIPDARVRVVADTDHDRLEAIGRRHPHIDTLTHDFHSMLRARLQAVVVCTPPETHFDIVSQCLEHGLDVLVEKPLATSADDARRLVEIAEQHGRMLMVGHIGPYNSAVSALHDMMRGGDLGDIAYIDAVRVGLGLFRPNLNVIWDLAPHDIAILMHLLGESPKSVSTRAMGCVESSIEDVAYLALTFPSGVLAHIRLSWLDPCKTRRITVVGSQKMVVYDDLENHEKLKIYDKRVAAVRRTDTFGDFQFAYHYGSVLSPHIQFEEPLRRECLHFLESVTARTPPLTDGRNGLEVVEVIESAQESLRRGGVPVPIPKPDEVTRARRWRPAKAVALAPATTLAADGTHGNGTNGNGANGNGTNGNGKAANGKAANGKGANGTANASVKAVAKAHRKAARLSAKAGGKSGRKAVSKAHQNGKAEKARTTAEVAGGNP